MKINFDVDIDMADRDKFLKLVDVIPASIKRDGEFDETQHGCLLSTYSKLSS